MYLIYNAVQPMPTALMKRIVHDAAGVLLTGIAVAWLDHGRAA